MSYVLLSSLRPPRKRGQPEGELRTNDLFFHIYPLHTGGAVHAAPLVIFRANNVLTNEDIIVPD